MERKKLAGKELQEAVEELPGWKLSDGRLAKTFTFPSFAEALGWMVSVGVYADKLDHHPDWSNSYNKVNVELMTHDMDAISTWDIELAKRMNKLF